MDDIELPKSYTATDPGGLDSAGFVDRIAPMPQHGLTNAQRYELLFLNATEFPAAATLIDRELNRLAEAPSLTDEERTFVFRVARQKKRPAAADRAMNAELERVRLSFGPDQPPRNDPGPVTA
jgi:hypothetical protein